ncbi:hypothetical protein E4U54_004050 [Claviceps lovelessii]|nr:hypothetical protein E4U54_004050 [Claviceps lovelessii]
MLQVPCSVHAGVVTGDRLLVGVHCPLSCTREQRAAPSANRAGLPHPARGQGELPRGRHPGGASKGTNKGTNKGTHKGTHKGTNKGTNKGHRQGLSGTSKGRAMHATPPRSAAHSLRFPLDLAEPDDHRCHAVRGAPAAFFVRRQASGPRWIPDALF